MTTPADLLSLASDLRDIRRYAPHWQHRLTKPIADRLYQFGMECLVFKPNGSELCKALVRLSSNLTAGRELITTSPLVLGGYVAAAEIELVGIAERMERGERACTDGEPLTKTEPANDGVIA